MTAREVRAMLKKVYSNTDPAFEGIKFVKRWYYQQPEEFKLADRKVHSYRQDAMLELPDEELVLQYAIFKM